MRSGAQITRLPREYRDHMADERQRNLRALLAELEHARATNAPWYTWVDKRRRGEHDHDAVRADGSPAACPVRGCPGK